MVLVQREEANTEGPKKKQQIQHERNATKQNFISSVREKSPLFAPFCVRKVTYFPTVAQYTIIFT